MEKTMFRFLIGFLFIVQAAYAGFPPTSSKISGDTSNITTFNYQFPNFTGTHTGITLSLGINSVAGGGTGLATTSQNFVFVGPTSGSGAPTWRLLTSGDLPSLSSLYLPLTGGTMSGQINMGSNKIVSMLDPTSAQDAATKNYVDTQLAQLNPAQAVTAASTATIAGTYSNVVSGICIGDTFTTTATSAFALDGTSPALNSRVLFKNQTSSFQDGVWVLTTQAVGGISGAVLTRATDFDSSSDINAGSIVPVVNGTVNAGSSWYQTAINTTCNTSSQTWIQFQQPSSAYLLSANNLSDVASKTTSFNNITPMTTLGDTTYENATPSAVRLAGNTTTTKMMLSQTGTGSVSAAPVWASLVSGDIPNNAANTTGTASNVTAGTFTNGSALFANSSGQIAEDNTNFFWNDTTFNLGLGTATPGSNTIIDAVNSAATAKSVRITGYGTGSSVGIKGQFARGTIGSPTPAQAGDLLSFFSGTGYGTSFPASTGVLNVVAGETFSGTSNATYLQFEVTPTGSVTKAEKMRLNSTGNLLLNTTTDNGAQLQVSGTATFSGAVTDTVAPVFSSLTGYLYGNGATAVTASTTIPYSAITGAPASGITRSISSVSSATAAGATALTDYVYFVSGTSTLTLPTAVGNANRYTIKNTGSNTVTIATTSSQTIDGSVSITLSVSNTSIDLVSDGANWRIL